MIDIVLLRIMKYKKDYKQLVKSIPVSTLDDKTKTLLTFFGKYFERFPEHDKIDLSVFLPRFRAWRPTMEDETFNVFVGILKNAQPDVDPETRAGIVSELYEQDTATRIANACSEYVNGELELPLATVVGSYLDAYKLNVGARAVQWNDTPIEELLLDDQNNDGIKWRLNCLNDSMRRLRPGDFGIVAGRPDKGKTTFLASELSYMASQLAADKNVLWLNNEGKSGSIVKRIYQAAVGKTISELVDLNRKGKLKQEYAKTVGRLDKIRVVDIHGMHIGQVEAIIEQSNPGIVVYDMIDNIKGFGSESRTDRMLEAMYQWARELCVKHDCIGLASSQISADGDNLQFPGQSCLKDSKTGKQGACDFQLMIGAVDVPELQNSRFISLPKNKLHREGHKKDPRAEVHYVPDKALYLDVENTGEIND